MVQEHRVVFDILREGRGLDYLQGAIELALGLVVVRHLDQDVAFGLEIRGHRCYVVFLLRDRILFVHGLQRLVHLAPIRGYYGHAEKSSSEFTIVARLLRHFLQFGGCFFRLAQIHLIGGNPEV